MTGSNGFSLGSCERVEHAMVRVNRWQAILLHLVLNNLRQAYHALLVVFPLTHNLCKSPNNINVLLKPFVVNLLEYEQDIHLTTWSQQYTTFHPN